jgi:hypothetical protein
MCSLLTRVLYSPDERVRIALRATTFNNLAIWYKCDGEAKKASFLKKEETVNAPFEKDSEPTSRYLFVLTPYTDYHQSYC